MRPALRYGLSVCVLVGTAAAASAGPLDPGRVPADTKWLIHIDIDEAQTTTVAQETATESEVQGALGWIRERYGIDVGSDLRSATIFGTSYEPHTGVAVLNTAYDRDKVIDVMDDEPDYKTTTLGSETLHSWTVETPAPQGQQQKLTMFAVLRDDQLLIGRSQDEIRKALDALAGKGQTLKGSDSPLVADLPEGSFFRGAAVDLKGLRERPGFAVLPQLQRVNIAIGDQEGKFFLDAKLIADNAETAEQIRNVIEGVRATIALQSKENKQAAELAEAIKITADKETINIAWKISAEELGKLVENAKQMRTQLQRGQNAGRPQPQRN